MKYKNYSTNNADIHIIIVKNYSIAIRFYVVDIWLWCFKYYVGKYFRCLYLPTCDISINCN